MGLMLMYDFNSTAQYSSLICSSKDEILNFCSNLHFDSNYNGVLLVAVSILFLIAYLTWLKVHEYSNLDYNTSSLIAVAFIKASLLLQIAFFIWLFYLK